LTISLHRLVLATYGALSKGEGDARDADDLQLGHAPKKNREFSLVAGTKLP
jgi:hypothetical protein